MKQLISIVQVVISNIVNFGSSFIVGFILPLVLSVSEYGKYKEFTLLYTFVYLFNFGYNDGIFIKYGGKKLNEIDSNEIKEEHTFIIYFQLLIFFIMIIYSTITFNYTFMWFSIITFFASLTTFYQNFLQSIGEFKLFSIGNITRSLVYLILLLIAILYVQATSHHIYIIVFIISFIFSCAFYQLFFLKQWGLSYYTNLRKQLAVFKLGIVILFANWSIVFVGNVGNIIVNFGFSIEDFAIYSFQTSILNVIILVINSVGVVFFNILSQNRNNKVLNNIKVILLLLGFYSGLTFYIFKYIIIHFLPVYVNTLPLLSVTLISVPYIMVSKILTTNLYKTRESKSVYFRDSILLVLFTFTLTITVYWLSRSMYSIAWCTVLSYLLWHLYTTRYKFSFLRSSLKEIMILIGHILVYTSTTHILNNSLGIFVYILFLIIVTYLYKDELFSMFSYFKRS